MEQNPDKFTVLNEFLNSPPSSDDNLAEEVIKEKIRFQKTSLDQIANLIIEREKTKQNNLDAIGSEAIKVQSQLFLYKCIVYPLVSDNKRKSTLERAISELENRRRQEEISCWKDTLKLWQYLLRIAAEYRALTRKAKVLLFSE